MTSVSLRELVKVYKGGGRAVDRLNLEIPDGEFMVLVGPSGCGKTTALRMIAGLEDITAGEIVIGGEVVNLHEPQKRDVAMVFQNYSLYPHMSVFENIAFPLRSRHVARQQVESDVMRIASMLGLQEMLHRKPRTLSGGQRQRVAMGRALVRRPRVFLMDEPLSNLDAKLRVQMRAEIATLQRELGITTVYVTHDQVEALTMGTRIAVMRGGILQQEGSPRAVYDSPQNLFVATFVGSPAMNLIVGRIEQADGLVCVIADTPIRLSALGPGVKNQLARLVGREIAVGLRPDHLSVADARVGNTEEARVVGAVRLSEMLGADSLLHIDVEGQPVLTDDVLEVARDTDLAVVETLEREARSNRVSIIARVGEGTPHRAGERVALAFDPLKLHFFSLSGGAAIA